ncbi:MAG: hypothetical protein ACKVT2_11855 [Saprospiraceae bacterium]
MDNKITDKGWAAMRELLDREMPEKRRRRFVWWWIGLLLLPFAGYGSWQWLGSENNPAPNIEAKSELPIASNRAAIEHSSNIAFDQQQAPATSSEFKPSTSTSSSTAKGLIAHSGNKSSRFNSAAAALEDSILQEIESKSNLVSFKNFELNPSVAIGNLPGTKLKAFVSEQVPSYVPSTFPIADLSKPIKKGSNNTWAFGVTSAISTEQFSTINGLSTGLAVDWKFAKKWGLRSGLLYNLQSPQEKHRPVASVLSDHYTSNVDGNVVLVDESTGLEVMNVAGNNFYTDSLSGNVFIPVNRLHRLEIPVTTFWQVNKPLKIFGGLALTRTFSAKADKQNYSGGYILKLADQTAEDGASKLSSSELDNWKADAMLGFGLNLCATVELGFSAKMPLNKVSGFSKKEVNPLNSAFDSDPIGSTRKKSGPVFSLFGTWFF